MAGGKGNFVLDEEEMKDPAEYSEPVESSRRGAENPNSKAALVQYIDQQEVKYKIDTPESPEVLVRHVKDIPLKGLLRFAEHISQEDACRVVGHKVSPESDQDVLVCRFLKFEEFDSSFRILTDVYDDTARGSAFLRCLDGPVQARAIRWETTSYKALRSGLAAAYRDQPKVQQALILKMQERFGRISRQAGEPICDFITLCNAFGLQTLFVRRNMMVAYDPDVSLRYCIQLSEIDAQSKLARAARFRSCQRS